MILYQLKVNIKTTSYWTDEELDAAVEEIESELENLKDLIVQKLSSVPRYDELTVEVTT